MASCCCVCTLFCASTNHACSANSLAGSDGLGMTEGESGDRDTRGTPKPRARTVFRMVVLCSCTWMAYSAGTTYMRSKRSRTMTTLTRRTNSASACSTHHSMYFSALIYGEGSRKHSLAPSCCPRSRGARRGRGMPRPRSPPRRDSPRPAAQRSPRGVAA